MIGGTDLFIGMFNNLAVFIVLISLYSYIKPISMPKHMKTLSLGILFALTLLVCMRVKIPVAEGVLVDQRNGIIVLSTLFGGPVSGLITLLAGTGMRIYLGGSGVLAGIIGMSLSLGAGMLIRQWKGERNIPFFLTGSFVAVLIILPGFLFVGDLSYGWNLLKKMAIPYGTPLYLGMIFVGFLLQHEENRIATSQKLRRSEKKYRTLYENLIDISYQVDHRGIIREISPSVSKVIGYSPKELTGSPITNIYLHPEERTRFLSSLENFGYVKDYELSVLGKEGRELLVSINSAADYDASNRITGYHGIIRDITQLQAERAQKEQLEKIVYQSQKMDALGSLAGGVAHDFNNILAAVLGFAELIRNNSTNKDGVEEYADQILQAGDRAAGLIRQILLFSRETTTTMREIEITPLVNEVIGLLQQTIPKTVSIGFEDGGVAAKVTADSNQLHQVILNLVTNAFHALPAEKGNILLTLQTREIKNPEAENLHDIEKGKYLSLSVKDDGEGIDEKDRPSIFDPFFTTKEKGKGTGLGLSVVHGIVKKHRGEIFFTSEVGRGTTFTVLLPLAAQKNEKERGREQKEQENLPRGSESIMILDDEESIAQVESHMLSSLGYKVRVFTDSRDARNELINNRSSYDMLLTDQSMPEISGVELAEEILAEDRGFPVIIVTGYSSVLDAERAEQKGISDIIIKPVSRKRLAHVVRRALDGA